MNNATLDQLCIARDAAREAYIKAKDEFDPFSDDDYAVLAAHETYIIAREEYDAGREKAAIARNKANQAKA